GTTILPNITSTVQIALLILHCAPLHYNLIFSFFFFNDPAATEIYTLSLHDALPIWDVLALVVDVLVDLVGHREGVMAPAQLRARSEEHTSELQSRGHLVCRLLLEKKKIQGNFS